MRTYDELHDETVKIIKDNQAKPHREWPALVITKAEWSTLFDRYSDYLWYERVYEKAHPIPEADVLFMGVAVVIRDRK
jgi:hypothetical protein